MSRPLARHFKSSLSSSLHHSRPPLLPSLSMRGLHLTAPLLALGAISAPNTSSDKITHKIASAKHDFVSLEFFPPKTPLGFENLQSRLVGIKEAIQPLFVSVTWGAGGSAALESLRLGAVLQRDLGITTLLHVVCRGMTRRRLDQTLLRARELGIRNILALKGDEPRDNGEAENRDAASGLLDADADASAEFIWAVDLVRYIRRTHGDYFCIGVAGYPEGHFNASHAASRSVAHDLPYLAAKVSAGSDFIMTQLFFNASVYSVYTAQLRSHPVLASIPVIPLFFAIPSARGLDRVLALAHATMPDAVRARLDAARGNDARLRSVGVDVVGGLVGEVRRGRRGEGPGGYAFTTLNEVDVVTRLVERTGLEPGRVEI